ncbi:MAG: hypothetical protein RIQ81_1710 [Pseudomonadota bacterium]|jgi:hypothetical protein
MTIIKRDRKNSSADLIVAIEKLIPLLRDQHEEEAIEDLQKAQEMLNRNAPGSDAHQEAVRLVVDAFEGDHELSAYTHQRAGATDWTEFEELSLASNRVLSLARRMRG